MNLSFLLLLPLVTCLAILCCSTLKRVRAAALAGAGLQCGLACVLLALFWQVRAGGNTATMIFQSDYKWFASFNIHFHTGIDGIALAMILLTAFVMLAAVLVSWNMDMMHKEFFFLLVFLSIGAYGFFISLDLFMLFFFLELAVIPKFLLIAIWGTGQKEYSAMKLALLLMAGSALVFTGLAGLYYLTGGGTAGMHSFSLPEIAQMKIPLPAQLLLFPFIFVGFGIFSALFPFHTWVPDGHSAAPTAASMFLAGISMKLGGFGCLRVATYLLPEAAKWYAPIIVALATIAIIYGAFATMMQQDLKYINAYSSVSHCGFVLLGIGMLTPASVTGAVLQMVSHGLMTALFFAAIGMLYSRTHTRMVGRLGGLLKVMPFIATVFVIAGLCSLGLPGLSGFVAEMTVFMGAWQNPGNGYRLSTVLACSSIVVTAVYILRAVAQTVMGPVTDTHYQQLTDAGWNERLAAGLLVTGIAAIGVAPFWLTRLVSPAAIIIMEQVSKAIPK